MDECGNEANQFKRNTGEGGETVPLSLAGVDSGGSIEGSETARSTPTRMLPPLRRCAFLSPQGGAERAAVAFAPVRVAVLADREDPMHCSLGLKAR